MKALRLCLLLWLATAVACVWPASKRDWPRPALEYAQWVMYSAEEASLPHAGTAMVLASLLLVGGAVLLFSGQALTYGRWSFCAGHALLAYAGFSLVPSISSGVQSVLWAVFLMLSGVIVGLSGSVERLRQT